MSTRVTPEEVKEIIDTNLGNTAIEAFIKAANITITDYVGEDSAGSDLTNEQLFELERWYTAHLIACTRERQISKEMAGQAQATYDGKTDMGLDATLYGQQCKIIDTTGTLANIAKTIGLRTASIYAITSFE